MSAVSGIKRKEGAPPLEAIPSPEKKQKTEDDQKVSAVAQSSIASNLSRNSQSPASKSAKEESSPSSSSSAQNVQAGAVRVSAPSSTPQQSAEDLDTSIKKHMEALSKEQDPPTAAKLLRGLAQLCFKKLDFVNAVSAAEKVLKIPHGDTTLQYDVHLDIATFLKKANYPLYRKRIIEMYRDASNLKTNAVDNTNARILLAAALTGKELRIQIEPEERREAEITYEMVLRTYIENAISSERKKNYDNSILLYRKSLEVLDDVLKWDPKLEEFRETKVDVLGKLADACFVRALARETAAARRKGFDEALPLYETALKEAETLKSAKKKTLRQAIEQVKKKALLISEQYKEKDKWFLAQ